MVGYRRNRFSGGTYFFTVVLQDRSSNYLSNNIQLLRQSFEYVRANNSYKTIAAVVLPDHLHVIWQLPKSDDDYPGRWKAIKSHFTRNITKIDASIVKNSRGEYALWQKRYWEHTIRNQQDLNTHINYIHFNPVKHGYVNHVNEWPYSTFHQYVKKGILPRDWGSDVPDFDGMKFGE